MKNFSKMALLCICLLITAMFTTACGGSKANPPSYPYFPINNQANNNGNNNQQNNNQQENNNNQEENNNNEEGPVANTEITLTLTDSLQADKIAFADIYYSIEDNTKKSSADDQEILKAEPNADDNTKFTVKVPDGIDVTKAKIKAILTYDSEENLLDYFSSYDGVEATSGSFDVDFGNSKDNEEGFGGGNGEDEPFIISAPRHFVNINKKDDEGNYLYFNKSFKQTANIDFSHLTGLKIVTADEDKDITIDVKNEKAPFYNEGKGIVPIGHYNTEAQSDEELYTTMFQGNYDGNENIIDGIVIVNSQTSYIGLFSAIYKATIQNLTIGENSIFFIDELTTPQKRDDMPFFEYMIGPIAGMTESNSTIEKCENRAKILISGLDVSFDDYTYCFMYISGISNGYGGAINNCTNMGNITIDNCKFNEKVIAPIYCSGISFYSSANEGIVENTNEGHINITNNKFNYYTGINIADATNKYTNSGNITVDGNTDIYTNICFAYNPSSLNNCTNNGNITVTNNKLNEQDGYISIRPFYAETFSNCVNNGNIEYNNNAEGYDLDIYFPYDEDGYTNNGTLNINGTEYNKDNPYVDP